MGLPPNSVNNLCLSASKLFFGGEFILIMSLSPNDQGNSL